MKSLKIILDSCNSPGILAVKMWIREGSRADPFNKNGIHNLLSSMLTRGCGPYNAFEIAELFESSGAELHCETYEDGLMISLKCMDTKSLILLPIFNYIITEPHFEEKQLILERNLSIQAIHRQKENPFIIAFNQWKKLIFENHPYAKEILGSKDELENIDRKDIILLSSKLAYREKTIVVSGALPTNIEKLFAGIKEYSLEAKAIPEKIIPKLSNENLRTSITIKPLETNQVIIILGKATISHSHNDDLSLRLLSCYLGSGMSSLLFRTLREKNGLTYDVGVYHPIREYQAPFLIHASSRKDKSLLTLKLLIKCWLDIRNKYLSKEELKLAKAKFIGNISHNSQTISQRSERKAHLIGLRMNANYDTESIKRLERITSEDIQESAINHLNQPILSLVGPKDSLIELQKYWLEAKS